MMVRWGTPITALPKVASPCLCGFRVTFVVCNDALDRLAHRRHLVGHGFEVRWLGSRVWGVPIGTVLNLRTRTLQKWLRIWGRYLVGHRSQLLVLPGLPRTNGSSLLPPSKQDATSLRRSARATSSNRHTFDSGMTAYSARPSQRSCVLLRRWKKG